SALDLQPSRRTPARPRDVLDDAADGIRSEEGALWATHHFEALAVWQRTLGQNTAPAERGRTNAVDEDQREVRFSSAREDRRHGPRSAIALNGQPRNRLERGAEHELLSLVDVTSAEHRDAVGCSRQRLI